MLLKIGELAKFTGYSREHLGREFRKYTGQILESYITESRINYSLSLLSDTDFSIAYIVNELGYKSQNSFTNNFRKQFGITPINWRKNHSSPERADDMKPQSASSIQCGRAPDGAPKALYHRLRIFYLIFQLFHNAPIQKYFYRNVAYNASSFEAVTSARSRLIK